MATIDASSAKSGRRALDHNIPLIPFIDFLLCLVSFLLITAVWSQMARLETSANVPGKQDGTRVSKDDEVLHVELRPSRAFKLVWKAGSTVVSSIDVPDKSVQAGDLLDYPELRKAVVEQWKTHGSHRASSDARLDQAVVHAGNSAEFREVAAVIDALRQPKRPLAQGSLTREVSAFNVTFAAD